MNKFMKAFTSWERQFRAAVQEQDAAEVGLLLDEMHVSLESKELEVLAREASLDVLKTYFEKVQHKGGWGWMFSPINYCIKNNLFDRVDLMLQAGLDFNHEEYRSHPLKLVLDRRAAVQQEEKACEIEYGTHVPAFDRRTYSIPFNTERALLEKIADCGISQVSNKQDFLWSAIRTNSTDVVDLLIQLGIDRPHVVDEYALRLAAEYGHTGLCRHLVEKHGADIEYTIRECRRLTECYDVDADEKNKMFKVILLLTELRDSMNLPPKEPPAPKKEPATLETVSAELAELRALVVELTRKLDDQSRTVRLDKPAQPQP